MIKFNLVLFGENSDILTKEGADDKLGIGWLSQMVEC